MKSFQQFILFLIVFYPIMLLGQSFESDDIIASWSFDEIFDNPGSTDTSHITLSYISQYVRPAKGISGTCIALDGYRSKVIANPVKTEGINELTIEAWVALQTYPWNKSAIINQGTRNSENSQPCKREFFIGVDYRGRLLFELNLNDSLYSVYTKKALSLLAWNHVCASYKDGEGIRLYINGQLESQGDAEGLVLPSEQPELWIGMNLEKLGPAGSERKASENILSTMVVEGLLDEIKIYHKRLINSDIEYLYESALPYDAVPLKYNLLPKVPQMNPPAFKAAYTRLNYTEEWENSWLVDEYPDIMIHFDKSPVKFIFWRGTGYGGVWISENDIWMADQSLERAGKGKSPLGCSEHMSDKQTRYSQVRILENNDARIVIHWRYALTDILYNIFGADDIVDWGEWADEYYYIYPDGISTRYQILYTDHLSHEWQETIVINQPGTCPEDNIEIEAMTFANMKGDQKTYSWEKEPPADFSYPDSISVQMVNLKSAYKPFIIFEKGTQIKPFRSAVNKELSIFPWWNHWPVAQMPNDGRRAFATDRPSHSSLSQSIENSDLIHSMGAKRFWAVTLTGMTNTPLQELVDLSRSWNSPPTINALTENISLVEISKNERAYIMQYKDIESSEILFTLNGSRPNPIINPVFVIQNYKQSGLKVEINGKRLKEGTDYRIGKSELSSDNAIIIWFEYKSTEITSFRISNII